MCVSTCAGGYWIIVVGGVRLNNMLFWLTHGRSFCPSHPIPLILARTNKKAMKKTTKLTLSHDWFFQIPSYMTSYYYGCSFMKK